MNMNPPKPAKNGTATDRPLRMLGSRSTLGGSSGTRPARSTRRSTTANASPSTGTVASSPTDHAGQPSALPSVNGTSSASSAAPSRRVPQPSTPSGFAERLSGTVRRAITSVTMPIGTFTRKIARQPRPPTSAATSAPPRTCPTTIDSPAFAP
jgi:hypothetical protein